ncbi:GNAT family N-acetyltransferase [Clostridium felsineum]|uniref:Uncharacterized protein n=1 Tax=Clostridium felsineum TaxID=36839 RepID=A0A1S8KZ67_9CLOT|nr:GNAT family N-acetyltransferase [Clostridium felsineum]URZ07646.1 hypothetical protein CLROS_029850 [Clostridium felsineum]URZ12677.1 hypothetical protein CROST_034000 [Clostridium felsineum]
MIEIIEVEDKGVANKLKNKYIEGLETPIDGFWQNVEVANSKCYEILYDGIAAGHFCVNSRKMLVQFYVSKEYYVRGEEIFKYIIKSEIVEKAAVSTKEPKFMALCLDYQKNIAVDSYIFTDNEKIRYELNSFSKLSFRLAQKQDIDEIKSKCATAFEGYYDDLIDNNQLFVLYDNDNLLGIGEFRIIKTHGEKYGDIGMHVVEKYREKGMGTYIIVKLKEHCYIKNLIPMACCDVKNSASKKTLEKSGFIADHRIIVCEF